VRFSIVQESAATLGEYASVPISFSAETVYDVSPSFSGHIALKERRLPAPIVRNYDSTSEGPASWPTLFDIADWAFFAAYVDGQRAGGAVVAFRTQDVEMLEGRDDLAVLWDLRVAPEYRGNGIGAALIDSAEKWSANNGATALKVETQNINVPACRRYARSGFVLRRANFGAYSDYPDEVQLFWYKDLSTRSTLEPR
jgi:GNAT superfamily N-acetyltransferase